MHLTRHLPNAITSCNLICGCIATGAAFHGHFTTAFVFILLGAFFDFFDGFSARLLGVSGPMGVELDSLADCVTFGLAPSAMIFVLFTRVHYPALLHTTAWHTALPFTAFLLAAFSALRLAKFNLDERQHSGFIGMPTPACAIFWGALISSSEPWLCSLRFNALFLLAFTLMFCFLLVSEIPMFALKFRSYDLSAPGNKVKYGFLTFAAVCLATSAITAQPGHIFESVSRATAVSILVYVALNIILSRLGKR